MLPGKLTRVLFRPVAPWRTASSVQEIDYEALKQEGVETILFDLDNTLVARDLHEVPADILSLMRRLRELGFNLCIVSNNWTVRVKKLASAAGVGLVAPAAKPFTRALRQAMGRAGGSPSTTILVGDQVFTDILGGNRLGVRTILVEPAGEAELPHTRLLRPVERFIISRLRKAGWLVGQ